jgi:hypothetical protein
MPEVQVIGAARGNSGMDPLSSLLALIGVLGAVSAAVFLTTGFIVVPGWLFILPLRSALMKPRILAMTESGVAVARPGVFGGKPKEIVARFDAAQLEQPYQRTRARRQVSTGSEGLWITEKELTALRTDLRRPAKNAA